MAAVRFLVSLVIAAPTCLLPPTASATPADGVSAVIMAQATVDR
jgi:hypothetical protein